MVITNPAGPSEPRERHGIAVAASAVAAGFIGASPCRRPGFCIPGPRRDLVGPRMGARHRHGPVGSARLLAQDGWTYRQTLSSLLRALVGGGTTTIGQLTGSADATVLRVAMTEDDGSPVITSHSAFTVDGVHFAAGEAARLAATSSANTSWNVEYGTGGCCASLDAHCRSTCRQPDCGSGGRGAVAR